MDIFGWIGAVLVSIQFLPQVIKLAKTKKANDLSLGMVVLVCVGAFFWILHGILVSDLPVLATNIFIFIVGILMLFFKLKYK